MKKIRYQGGLTKLITSEIGKKNKSKFSKYIEKNLCVLSKEITQQTKEMDVVSFSSSKDFYDQILSILSFIRYVGTPSSWTVYSDGSHSDEQIALLKAGFSFLKVETIDWTNRENLKQVCKTELLPYLDYLLDYALKQPLGKKLFLYLNYNVTKPTFFLDSDIMFYCQASVFDIVFKEEVNGWYLPDAEWVCLDSRYKQKNVKQLYQVNSGLLLFNKNLSNLSEGLDFLKSLNYDYEYFSEQTVLHILLKTNGFQPLDPRIFVLNSADQFDFSYLYPREKIATRHYTGPVRHKMWQRDWKWQLSLA